MDPMKAIKRWSVFLSAIIILGCNAQQASNDQAPAVKNMDSEEVSKLLENNSPLLLPELQVSAHAGRS